jgi:hypothetical protein
MMVRQARQALREALNILDAAVREPHNAREVRRLREASAMAWAALDALDDVDASGNASATRDDIDLPAATD